MLAYLFVVVAVAVRFLPHPLAFTPVGAALLYFGARGSRKQLWIPVALLAASDVLLNKFVYSYPFRLDQFVTIGWYAAVICMGGLLRTDSKPMRVAGASLATAVSFFLASNFAVWAFWSMYPKTMGGLATSYVAGLPFFRNEIASDLFFSAVMFGIGALVSGRESEGARIAA